MIEIIPAVLPNTYADIETKAALVAGVVPVMQIDLADGRFVPNKTWGYNGKDQTQLEAILHEEQGLPFWEKLNFEIDAMVADPITDFEMFIKLGASRIIFHFESLSIESWQEFFNRLDPYYKEQLEFGMAINIDTSVAALEPLLEQVQCIQCMGIEHVGFQGQPFDTRVIDQVKAARAMTALPIAVDGGVNLETAPLLANAGATRLVVGSALFQSSDIRGTLEAFKQVCIAK